VATGFEPAAEPASGFDPLGWAWGQCTAFAAEVASWVQGSVQGNAENWLASGAAAGLPTSKTPAPGDIAVFSSGFPGSGGAGHVAVVTGVNGSGDEFSVEQGNVQGVDVASAGEYSTSNPYLEGFLEPPSRVDTGETLIALSDVTGAANSPAGSAAAAAAAASSSSSGSTGSSVGAQLGSQAVSGVTGMLDSLVGWFDTPRLVGFAVAAVVMYMGWSSTLQGGPTNAD